MCTKNSETKQASFIKVEFIFIHGYGIDFDKFVCLGLFLNFLHLKFKNKQIFYFNQILHALHIILFNFLSSISKFLVNFDYH